VLQFLFHSAEFPRAVNHCVEAARTSLKRLPRNEAALRVAGRVKRTLASTDLALLSQSELHAFVDDLQLGIGDLHAEIANTWFPPPLEDAA
jgi:uncharacterized alpha-E superfamily protein